MTYVTTAAATVSVPAEGREAVHRLAQELAAARTPEEVRAALAGARPVAAIPAGAPTIDVHRSRVRVVLSDGYSRVYPRG